MTEQLKTFANVYETSHTKTGFSGDWGNHSFIRPTLNFQILHAFSKPQTIN